MSIIHREHREYQKKFDEKSKNADKKGIIDFIKSGIKEGFKRSTSEKETRVNVDSKEKRPKPKTTLKVEDAWIRKNEDIYNRSQGLLDKISEIRNAQATLKKEHTESIMQLLEIKKMMEAYIKFRSVSKVVDDDHMLFEMFEVTEAGERKVMKIDYTRK